MKRKLFIVALSIFVLLGISACGSYYMVKDIQSDKTFFTKEIEKEKGGAVRFKDANTGSTVTIQNSAVKEINKEEFKANTAK
jgi:hypothetical protein